MIWYFQEDLGPSIKVEIEERGRKLNSFEELVEKAVDAEARAAFRPCFYVCKTDKHSLQDSRPSAAKASTQGQLIKDPRVKKPKFRT